MCTLTIVLDRSIDKSFSFTRGYTLHYEILLPWWLDRTLLWIKIGSQFSRYRIPQWLVVRVCLCCLRFIFKSRIINVSGFNWTPGSKAKLNVPPRMEIYDSVSWGSNILNGTLDHLCMVVRTAFFQHQNLLWGKQKRDEGHSFVMFPDHGNCFERKHKIRYNRNKKHTK